MSRTVLILGANGRFGRHAARAFASAGWTIRRFDRSRDSLSDAARGAGVIVNGWNPPYPLWERAVPEVTRRLIDVSSATGALVVIPGNVYPYGETAPSRLSADTPHAARNRLGRVRAEMEAAWRESRSRTLILRCGDFIDTAPSGNWFDKVIAAGLGRGRMTYPGPLDRQHAWAYLPDAARAAVALVEHRGNLDRFTDIGFPGYTLTGAELAAALHRVTGVPLRVKRMPWLPLRAAAPLWPTGRGLVEMRYLWSKPHTIDARDFRSHLPGFRDTPLDAALASAIQVEIDPDQAVAGGRFDQVQSGAL